MPARARIQGQTQGTSTALYVCCMCFQHGVSASARVNKKSHKQCVALQRTLLWKSTSGLVMSMILRGRPGPVAAPALRW